MSTTHFLTFAPFFLFVPLWFFGSWLSAFMSGWASLAQKYRDNSDSQGSWVGWRSARFNNYMEYKGCMWFSADQRGLHLKTGPLFLFQAFHPQLCIPWSAITSVEQRQVFWSKLYVLSIEGVDVKIHVYASTLDVALPYLRDKLTASNRLIA
jgi:hypothetical protein